MGFPYSIRIHVGSKYTHLVPAPTVKGTLHTLSPCCTPPFALIPHVCEIKPWGESNLVISITYRETTKKLKSISLGLILLY